jgi:hypothetical protein
MSAKGAEQLISNPVGKIMDQAGLERPKIKMGDYSLDLTALTSPTGFGQMGQIQNIATVTETKRLERKAAAAEEEKYKQDLEAMNKFKAQEGTLLGQSDLFTPVFKSGKGQKLAQEAEALSQIFNARKQEALQRRSTPGVSQTRMS